MEDLELLLYLAVAIMAYGFYEIRKEIKNQTSTLKQEINRLQANESEYVDNALFPNERPYNIRDIYDRLGDLPAEIAAEMKEEALGYQEHDPISLGMSLVIIEGHLREIKNRINRQG